MEHLFEERERYLNLSSQLKFIRFVRVYLAFYQTSRKQLSNDIGVSQSTLSKVLCGNHDMVSEELWVGTLYKLERYINFNKFITDFCNIFNLDEDEKIRLSEIERKLKETKEFIERLNHRYQSIQ